MSDVIKIAQFPPLARNPLAWSLTLLLAGLAWIPTLQQTLGMLSMHMYGTMGMTLLPFLFFWTIMMAAMMLPALAPTVSLQMTSIRQQTAYPMTVFIRSVAFLLGYLLVWGLFGIPVFVFCLCVDHFVLSLPSLALWLGILLFVGAGLYQFTPQKKRALLHCNPAMNARSVCPIATPSDSIRVRLREGLQHGVSCLQCCGILMLILIAVGLMNLFWMVLLTIMIFLENVWTNGQKLSAVLGFVLIFYGLFAFVSPLLLPGL
jgi:predicted metal-binding membrane protein